MKKAELTTETPADAKPVLAAGWISVNETKPNNKDKVLVNCEHGVTMAEYTKFDNGNEMWWAVLCIGTYEDSGDAKQVTHWMPLPCPPAGGYTKPLTNNPSGFRVSRLLCEVANGKLQINVGRKQNR